MTRLRRRRTIIVVAFGILCLIFVLLQFQQLSSISSSEDKPIIISKEDDDDDDDLLSFMIPSNPKETAGISIALDSIIKQPSSSDNNNNISFKAQQDVVTSIRNCPITRQVKIIISSSSNCSNKKSNNNSNTTNTTNTTTTNSENCRQQQQQRQKYWLLQTYDEYGKPKEQGGDEFYITYTEEDHASVGANYDDNTDHDYDHDHDQEHDNNQDHPHPHAIADITDLFNGLYKLEFISNPLYHHHHHRKKQQQQHGYGYNGGKKGTLTVVFQYICGIGQLNPPMKSYWTTGGATIAKFSINISTTTTFPQPPIITPFPYFGGYRYYNDEFDNNNNLKQQKQQQQQQQRVYIDNIFDEYGNNNIVAVGDSIMKQFVKPLQLKIPNIGIPLNTTTLHIWKSTIEQRILEVQQQQQQQQQYGDSNNNNKTNTIVLLLSSHAWDLLETQHSGSNVFIDHEQALRELLTFVISSYPKKLLKIYWKSPTALHIHVPYLDIRRQQQMIRNKIGFLRRIKYMSESRSRMLYELQRRLIEEEFSSSSSTTTTTTKKSRQQQQQVVVQFLDVYKASSIGADATKTGGDGRHYNEKFNIMSMNWFLRYSIVDEIFLLRKKKKNYSKIHYDNKIMSSTTTTTTTTATIVEEPTSSTTTTTSSLNILHVDDKESKQQQQQQQLQQQRFLVMDCTTTTSSSSWVNIVNGILLATITNRTIVWKENNNNNNNNSDDYFGSCMTSPSSSFWHLLDSQWKMSINDSSVELLRKRKEVVVEEFSTILSSRKQTSKKILSLEELRKIADLGTSSEHDIRYTNILYSEGEDYLFGMILYNILRNPPSISLSTPQSLSQLLLPKQQGSLFENQTITTTTTHTNTNTATSTTSGSEKNHFMLPSESIVVALDNTDLLQQHLSATGSSCIDKILQSIISLYPFLPCHILILIRHEKQQQQADDDNNKIVAKFYNISSSATGKTKNCTIVPIQAESIRNIITREEDYNNNNNSMNDSFFQDTLSYLSIIANLEVDAYITSSCDDDGIGSDDVKDHSNAAMTSSWEKGMLWYLQSQVARDKGVLPIDPIPFHCCRNTHQ